MPGVIVCLGATAAQSIIGPGFKVTERRGEIVPSPLADAVVATVHPSSILREPDDEARRRELRRLVDDLRTAARAVSSKQR